LQPHPTNSIKAVLTKPVAVSELLAQIDRWYTRGGHNARA